MGLRPDTAERLARLRGDLRMGVPVVLSGGGESVLVLAVESMSEERFNEICRHSQPSLAITARRAETLHARAYDGDLARLKLPDDASFIWCKSVVDPARDMDQPMKGPFHSLRDGNAELHRAAIALCKQARLLPAALVAQISDGRGLSADNELNRFEITDADGVSPVSSSMQLVAAAKLPLEVAEAGKLHVFRPQDGGEEHYAVEIGQPPRQKPVLARLHSACFTGDLIGSLKCDCGAQLRAALGQIGNEGSGVLLYLNQEGRGIGLANKMRAYSLQNQGFDTVEANHRLGFEDDERDLRIGAELLKSLGFTATRLMTNNPRKVEMMGKAGIEVIERVPLIVGENRHNAAYLATKAAKSGHLL